jgi:hypothetical protein
VSDDPLRGIDFSERIKPLMQEMILLDQKRMAEIERLRGEVRYWRGAHERQSLKAGRFKAERDRARAERDQLAEALRRTTQLVREEVNAAKNLGDTQGEWWDRATSALTAADAALGGGK